MSQIDANIERHDPLTRLANRYGLEDYIANEDSKKSLLPLAISIELCNFGSINAHLGTEVGDKLLKMAAKRLHKLLPQATLMARLNGDSFVATLSEVDDLDDLTHTLLEFLQRPYFIKGEVIVVEVRLGIAKRADDSQLQNKMLVNQSEIALHFGSKRHQAVTFYSDFMRMKASSLYQLEHALRANIMFAREALHHGDHNPYFEVVYRPIYHFDQASSDRLAHIVWHHENKVVRTEELFVVAERTGYVEVLLRWLIARVCADLVKQDENEISPTVFLDCQTLPKVDVEILLNQVDVCMKRVAVTADQLGVIAGCRPSTLLMVREFFARLQQLGVKTVLGNLGTEECPLAMFSSLPLNGILWRDAAYFEPKLIKALNAFSIGADVLSMTVKGR